MTERTLDRFQMTRIALTAALTICGASAQASAGVLLASDSYAIGSDPTMGQYVAGNSLSNYNGNVGQPGTLTNTGFANGGYNGGIGTGNFQATSAGLISAADGADSSTGAVTWTGSQLDSVQRSVARNVTPFNETTTSSTYWISMLVSNTSTVGSSLTNTNGFVLSGFANTTFPAFGNTFAGSPPAAAYLYGLYIGFANDSGSANEADLVIRDRNTAAKAASDTVLVNGANNSTAGQTYLVVAQVNVNYSGSYDKISYWVNPPDLNSIDDLNQTAIKGVLSQTYAFQGQVAGPPVSNDFTRLNYAAYNWDGTASFDEARLGTSLDSIAPAVSSVPEPASLAMTALGCGVFGLVSYRRRRRSAC